MKKKKQKLQKYAKINQKTSKNIQKATKNNQKQPYLSYLFSFYKIGNVSVFVRASLQVPQPCAVLALARHNKKVNGPPVNRRRLHTVNNHVATKRAVRSC